MQLSLLLTLILLLFIIYYLLFINKKSINIFFTKVINGIKVTKSYQ